MTIDMAKIYVVLPAYNEESSVSQTVNNIRAALPGANIWVIDNASEDLTAIRAAEAGACVLHEPQRGKGFAFRQAISRVPKSAQAVLLVDADDTYGYESALSALELVVTKGFDMVVGTRTPVLTSIEGRKPTFRRGHGVGNYLISRLSRLLHRTRIYDSLSGWRVFSVPFLKSFPGGASGFEIEAELNAHADLLDVAVANVEVSYQGRTVNSDSKLNTYSDGFRIIRMNLALFRNNRPQLAFSLLCFPWLVLSLVLVTRSILRYLKTGLVQNFPSLIAGVGAFIVCGLLWVSGLLLQRIKIIRANQARYVYNKWMS